MEQNNRSMVMAVDCVKSDSTKIKNAVSMAAAVSQQIGLLPRAVTIINPKLFNWPLDFDDSLKAAFINFGEDSLDDLFKQGTKSFPTDVVYQDLSSRKKNIDTFLITAKEKKASAIAVFTHARRGHGFAAPGSFISTLITQSPLPVLVINSETKKRPEIKTILLATDFSNQSDFAINESFKLASQLNAQLIIAHVLPTIPHEASIASSVLAGGIATAGAFLFNQEELLKSKGQLLVKQAKAMGVDAQFVLLRSTYAIADSIMELAAGKKADLMILTERTGPWETVLLGSVTRRILSESELPVWVLNDSVNDPQSFGEE